MTTRWSCSIRSPLVAVCLLALAPAAQDTASTFPLFRLCLTVPVITSDKFIGAQFKAFGGVPRFPERFGIQGQVAGDLSIGDSPNSNKAMIHLLVGREFSRTGPFSLQVTGGPGWVWDEESIPSRTAYDDDYVRRTSRPSTLIMLDVGVSLLRHLGVGLDAGAVLNARPSFFAGTRFEIGNW